MVTLDTRGKININAKYVEQHYSTITTLLFMSELNRIMESIKVEFSVKMPDENCANAVRQVLEGTGQIDVDFKAGRVVVQTEHPWIELLDKIQSTGCRAVLTGFGGLSAVAVINTTGSVTDHTHIQGVARFTPISANKPGAVIDGVVDGLTPGLHGLHIHETGDISLGCKSVGEHYNPRNSPHGGLNDDSSRRHAGDLGNIRADSDGRATFRFVDSLLEVPDIIGRALVLTECSDDLGKAGNAQSLIDGNSGERIACGLIARSAGILQNFKKICACDGVSLWDERNKPSTAAGRSQKL